MKILYLVNAYPRVSHTFIRREIHALEGLGLEVLRVSIRPPDGSLVDPVDVEEVERTHCLLRHGALGLLPASLLTLILHPVRFGAAFVRTIRLSHRGDTGLVRHLACLAEACVVARIARRARVDHVHAHFGTNASLVALLVAALGGPGFSFTVHGPEEFDRALGLGLAEKVAAARFTVAISSFARAQLQRLVSKADHARIHVVHCGLDAGMLEQVPGKSTAGHDLLFIGRLCAQKQPLRLVEAATRLVAQGVDFRLRVAGTGELESDLAARISEAGLERQFEMLGSLDGAGILRELRRCRALVLPSAAEGLPIVLMEALALGRPVITTFVGGIPELIRSGQEGWLTPAGDDEALADAMKAALRAGPDELERMGASGAARVRQRHDVRDSARALAELFRQHRRTSQT